MGVSFSCLLTLLFGLWARAPIVALASTSDHTNNWAVIIDASRYWFNYRHIANTLSFYRIVKNLGIPDSQIILMLAEEVACDARNVLKGQVFNDRRHSIDLYGDDIEVDYRGAECNVENVLRVLTGRHDPDTPASRRLRTDERSNILVFMTGHGGDTFLKFHDKEEIQSQDIADAFTMMHQQKRYNEILFMVDTCQAATLFSEFTAPNIVSIGSSKKGESSYSYEGDYKLGVSIIDRFTFYTLDFFERGISGELRNKVKTLFDSYNPRSLHSHATWDASLMRKRPFEELEITDYFSAIATDVELLGDEPYHGEDDW